MKLCTGALIMLNVLAAGKAGEWSWCYCYYARVSAAYDWKARDRFGPPMSSRMYQSSTWWPFLWEIWKCRGILQMSGKCLFGISVEIGKLLRRKILCVRLILCYLLLYLAYFCFGFIVLTSFKTVFISEFNTSSTCMKRVPVKMARSVANHQGNFKEYHSVWKMVTLSLALFTAGFRDPGWYQKIQQVLL